MIWWREALTDDKGEFDVAPIGVALGLIGIMSISAYSVIVNKQPFDAWQVGSGCGAIITSLLASKWGDAKVRQATPPGVTTTIDTARTVTTTKPLAPPSEVDDPDAQPAR